MSRVRTGTHTSARGLWLSRRPSRRVSHHQLVANGEMLKAGPILPFGPSAWAQCALEEPSWPCPKGPQERITLCEQSCLHLSDAPSSLPSGSSPFLPVFCTIHRVPKMARLCSDAVLSSVANAALRSRVDCSWAEVKWSTLSIQSATARRTSQQDCKEEGEQNCAAK